MPTADGSGDATAPVGGRASGDQRRLILILAIAAVVVLVVVVAAALAMAGGGGGDDDVARHDVEVPGTRPFTDTGVDLAVGDRLVINASGTVLHSRTIPTPRSVPTGPVTWTSAAPT